MEAGWPSCHSLSRPRLGLRWLISVGRPRSLLQAPHPGVPETAPQRVHEVDNVRLWNLVARHGEWHALAFTLDDLAQCLLVPVDKQRGSEVPALLVDNLLRNIKHLWISLRQFDRANFLHVANLLMGPECRQHDFVTSWLKRADPLARAHHQPSNGYRALLLHCLTDYGEGLNAGLAGGHKVIRRVPVQAIYRGCRDE